MPMVEGFICNGLSIGKADIGDFQPMAMVEMSHARFSYIPSEALFFNPERQRGIAIFKKAFLL